MAYGEMARMKKLKWYVTIELQMNGLIGMALEKLIESDFLLNIFYHQECIFSITKTGKTLSKYTRLVCQHNVEPIAYTDKLYHYNRQKS